ncbi:MAG: glycosyltransferase, partial [Oscillospiraceae bacterium]
KYYQLGDVFVSASQSETQGLTYVEALASGLPALCREDDCLEGVVVDGVNGYQYSGFDEFSRRLNDIMVDKSG